MFNFVVDPVLAADLVGYPDEIVFFAEAEQFEFFVYPLAGFVYSGGVRFAPFEGLISEFGTEIFKGHEAPAPCIVREALEGL